MDMSAYHTIIILFNGQFSYLILKLFDLHKTLIELFHYAFRKRQFFFSGHFHDPVDAPVKGQQYGITVTPQLSPPFGKTGISMIKYIAMEYPGHLAIDLYYYFISKLEIP